MTQYVGFDGHGAQAGFPNADMLQASQAAWDSRVYNTNQSAYTGGYAYNNGNQTNGGQMMSQEDLPPPVRPPISSIGLPSKKEGKDYLFQEGCSLIVNYLPPSMSHEELKSLFSAMGSVQSCRVMQDSHSGASKGFGFVNYLDPADAQKAIEHYNGLRLQNKMIKVSFARPCSDEIKGTNVYVSGLPTGATEQQLHELFSSYGTIITSTLLKDSAGKSRGQGLIRFNVRQEAETAIQGMHSTTPQGFEKPLIVRFANPPQKLDSKGDLHRSIMSPATSPPPMGNAGMMVPGGGPMRGPVNRPGMRFSPMETNKMLPGQNVGMGAANQSGQVVFSIYVVPLEAATEDIDLYRLFSPFGALQSVKVLRDTNGQCKGFGFVNMFNYHEALVAIQRLNGWELKGKKLSVSFKANRK